MSEILIHDMDDGVDGNLTFLGKGLPASPEAIEEMMIGAKVPRPYIAHSYTFRLNELNGQITGPQPLVELNSFAEMLGDLSEYERVKLEGAVLLTDCKTIDDCTKLLYNLDSFDLTPNVGDYEALGRYFAANDFADSLAAVPSDMMEHFDYGLLGRMGWDDSTNVFIKGHHIRDTEHEMCEPDLTREPNPTYLKLRFVSDHNRDGVWLKFPLSGMEAVDAPETSGEMMVALKSLGVDSIEDARVKNCYSRYPVLTKCMEYSEGHALSDLIWDAHNLGLAESELGQYGKDAYAKFAAALEYEDCGDLNLASDITQNLRCYDFAPTLEAYAEKYLTHKGVDSMLASCFDLKMLGNTLAADNGVVITESGVISRNDHDFVFEYCHFPQENYTQEKEIRLFCPLEVKTDPGSTLGEQYGDCPNEFEYATIPNSIVGDYKDEILAALEKEMHPEEQEHGLAKYLDSDLAAKVSYIWPSVEVHDNELWGVIDVRLNQDLSTAEFADLTDWCIGQMSDGLGEGIEQHPIKTQDGDLYVSFWHSGDDYFMKPEQEFKQDYPEQDQIPQMGM